MQVILALFHDNALCIFQGREDLGKECIVTDINELDTGCSLNFVFFSYFVIF